MNSNFHFLKDRFVEYYNLAVEAEINVKSKPRTSAFYSRLAMEELIKWIYNFDPILSQLNTEKKTLEALMYNESFKMLLSSAGNLIDGMTLIRKNGNQAVHNKTEVSMRYAYISIQNLFEFTKWVYYTYVDSSERLPFLFDVTLLPNGDGSGETTATVKALEGDIQRIRAEAEKTLRLKDEELSSLRAEIAQIKCENQTKAQEPFSISPTTEAETRRVLIDVMLRELGWDLEQPNCKEFKVVGMPNESGNGFVDYVLWGDNGLPLAVVEAKNTLLDPQKGRQQAKLYADCLTHMYGRRPILFYTNGYESWIWDDTLYPPRKVSGFQTKDELEWSIQKRGKKPLQAYEIKKAITDRPYQERAIKRIAETFESLHRKGLLVMATGTGKTRTAISIVDMLMCQGWARKVLFLADRKALIIQGKNNFVKQLPSLSCIDITKEKEDIDLYKMVFSTYPTMMNKIDSERINNLLVYSPAHFDLIIIDEAHRSVYQKYKAIFSYFDALLIGLTATPKSEVDKNTYELFELEDHNPTDFYELDEAVKDGWLVPPKRVSVTTKFMSDGIKYNDLSEEDKGRYEEDFVDELTGEIPDEIGSPLLNKYVFNQDTIDLVITQLMTEGLKIEGGDKLGKTIIFAKNHDHAEYIVKRFDALYPHLAGNFARVIDHYEDYAQNLLEDFSTVEKMPQIAVSVDMLDTGIDVPEILNLVFFKVVRSATKFWQMIGRGTRLCPALFGIPEDENDKSKDKKEFLIFDYCQNFEFFDINPDGYENKAPKSISQRTMECQISLACALDANSAPQGDENMMAFRNDLLDRVHSTVLTFNRKSFVVKEVLGVVDKFSERESWNTLSLADTSEIYSKLTPLAEPLEKDETARNFDFLMLRFMLAITDGNESTDKYETKVKILGKTLLKSLNVPMVKQKEDTLRMIVSEHFWKNEVSVISLEKVRQDIRSLIKHIKKEIRKLVYTNLQDEISSRTTAPVMATYTASESYKQRVEMYVRENENSVVIQKLKRNIPITHTEVEVLEEILFDGKERGTKQDFIEVYGDKPLGHFIRSIVGLDRNAADTAFSEFLRAGSLTANQNQFISMIIDFLTKNGVVDSGMLFESPFTQFHHEGIVGVFGEDGTYRIINILEKINLNAVA